MKTIILFLLICLHVPIALWAQSGEYVILTFSSKRTKYDKEYTDRTWIVPYDSIRQRSSYSVFPLVVDDGESSMGLNSPEPHLCMQLEWAIQVYPNTPTLSMVKEKGRLIQTFKTAWPNGGKGTMLRIYATPVKGVFKRMYQESTEDKGNRCLFYYTTEPAVYWEDFWSTEKAHVLLSSDFSKVNYRYEPVVQGVATIVE